MSCMGAFRGLKATQDSTAVSEEKILKFVEQSNAESGGRSRFIFNTKHGRPIMPAGVNSFLKNIVNAYNKKESKLAEEEKREPELMPPISSHGRVIIRTS